MKKQSKLTRNQFRKMIQEEISNLTDLVLEEEGDVAADDEEEGEEEEDEDAAMAKGDAAQPSEDNNDMSKLQTEKITREVLRKMLREEFQNVMSEDDEEEEEESTEFAEAIAALERMRGNLKGIAAEIADFRGARRESNALNAQIDNLEGIIDRLKEVPGAPLGTDIYMAHPGLDPES